MLHLSTRSARAIPNILFSLFSDAMICPADSPKAFPWLGEGSFRFVATVAIYSSSNQSYNAQKASNRSSRLSSLSKNSKKNHAIYKQRRVLRKKEVKKRGNLEFFQLQIANFFR
ncbi:MAG: hypothetical protein IJ042_00555, partial [Butyricicoccus sp.]|nr:hypothetical protein [Butyricicoccus sp.]